jgi:hypothetical protein
MGKAINFDINKKKFLQSKLKFSSISLSNKIMF